MSTDFKSKLKGFYSKSSSSLYKSIKLRRRRRREAEPNVVARGKCQRSKAGNQNQYSQIVLKLRTFTLRTAWCKFNGKWLILQIATNTSRLKRSLSIFHIWNTNSCVGSITKDITHAVKRNIWFCCWARALRQKRTVFKNAFIQLYPFGSVAS